MPANIPSRTTVTNRAGDAWNKLIANSRSHEPMQSDGMLTGHTVHGTFREPEPSMPAYGAAPVATETHVEMFLYKSAGTGADADLLKCRTWDGVVEGSTDVWILKPYKLRKINAQIVGGSTIVYTWDATYLQRTASIGTSIVEVQTIIPRYIAPYSGYAGDIIHAGKLKYPQIVNLQTIEYVDLNVDGRAWAKSF